MHLRSVLSRPLSLGALAVLAACSVWPTGEDIERGLEAQLQSVAGSWSAVHVTGDGSPPALTMSFRLAEAAGGQVTGAGGMQERGQAALGTVVVDGSFTRPDLSLSFDGMTYEGRSVRGTFHGRYVTAAGVADTLVLTAAGYTRRLPMLLQEVGP